MDTLQHTSQRQQDVDNAARIARAAFPEVEEAVGAARFRAVVDVVVEYCTNANAARQQ